MSEEAPTTDLVTLTADLLSAYVANNRVDPADLPSLIASTHSALAALGSSGAPSTSDDAVARPSPARIRKSITENGLISFEDGKSYKTLKRHLSTRGLTPEAYRAKWSLPGDYPMTAPAYSAARSQMAKKIGLGAKGRKPVAKSSRTRKGRS